MSEDQGEDVALVIETHPQTGKLIIKETYIPGNNATCFEPETLTNLYIHASKNQVEHLVKPLKNQYAFMQADLKGEPLMVTPPKINRIPEGLTTKGPCRRNTETYSTNGLQQVETPYPVSHGIRQVNGFRKIFDIKSISEDLEERHESVSTMNLFPRVPEGLEGTFAGITVSMTTDYLGNARNQFYESLKQDRVRGIFATKKYKPVALKTRSHLGTLPEEFRIKRHILGDPLADMPQLSKNPTPFVPTGRYTAERREQIQKDHDTGFLQDEELKLVDNYFMLLGDGFAWEESQKGRFKEEFFPSVDIPVIPHTPWVLRNIPIPPGIYEEVCKIIKHKIDSGVYEPSNSSYRSRWFCVVKKDGKKLRLVHSLEPLNAVTIAHSGLPPATEELAEAFAGLSCGGTLDLYVGYDERTLATASRDMTTFSTPYGALRLRTLPMGWTNSVPIFHDDVCYILREEIPAYTRPYIDDVPVKGPSSRYELPDGTYETLPENPGIRRFVWEHFQTMVRIVQRMKYAGGTFSGTKAIICAEEIVVVGHVCTRYGRKPAEERVKVISDWPACNALTEVRSFLGTAGIFRAFVKDYSKLALPLTRLTKDITNFEWGEEEQASMDALKEAIRNCPMLKPLRYDWETPITLSVDTSYQAVGFYLSQLDPEDVKKRYYAKFMSITLNEREARYSQAKRELYGLYRALTHCKYYLLGCRKLLIEVDAKYIKGMLSNVDSLANANLQRWAEEILMFHFTLEHVPGKVHGPDGLSRRPPSDQDEILPRPPLDDTEDILPTFIYEENENLKEEDKPLPFEVFKDHIDTRTGYMQWVAIDEFQETEWPPDLRDQRTAATCCAAAVVGIEDWLEIEEFPQLARTDREQQWDKLLPHLQPLLEDEEYKARALSTTERTQLEHWSKNFFVRKDKLYKTHDQGAHQRVLSVQQRVPIVRLLHDRNGHKGQYSLYHQVCMRFWWPGMNTDIQWYVRTCVLCQQRQKKNIRIAPTITSTPGIFERAYVDTFRMPKSGVKNKKTAEYKDYNAVTVARCGLTGWPEARALVVEDAKTLGEWIFEDILCRWGCLKEIITDNGPAIKKAMLYIEEKYGIRGILISPYNKQANGKVERGHWDIRQSLFKVCRGDPEDWPAFLHEILWAERITVKRSLGTSPFHAVTGCDPILPLDLDEVTWLVDTPDKLLSHSDLVAMRARQLKKHNEDTRLLKSRVAAAKKKNAAKYLEEYVNSIPNHVFETGELVLVRNTRIESEMNAKFKERFMGPYAVVARTTGGNYVLCDLNGVVLRDKIAKFRVIPFFARRDPLHLGGQFFRKLERIKDSVLRVVDALAKKAK